MFGLWTLPYSDWRHRIQINDFQLKFSFLMFFVKLELYTHICNIMCNAAFSHNLFAQRKPIFCMRSRENVLRAWQTIGYHSATLSFKKIFTSAFRFVWMCLCGKHCKYKIMMMKERDIIFLRLRVLCDVVLLSHQLIKHMYGCFTDDICLLFSFSHVVIMTLRVPFLPRTYFRRNAHIRYRSQLVGE